MSTSYLKIVEGVGPRGNITQVWDVNSRGSGDLLGQIRWYWAWRQYCFYPSGATIWSPSCLHEVIKFCLLETGRRKDARRKAKEQAE